MSSPRASLKRVRRTPLSRHTPNSVPFRTEEDQLLAKRSFLPLINPRQTHDQIVNSIQGEQRKTAPPSDESLLSSMAARLAMVERELLSAKREIIEKDNRIRRLEENLSIKESSSLSSENELKCEKLQKQVHEMETFLSDYGMVWVGEGQISSHTHTVWYPADSSVTEPVVDQIDFDKLVSNIRELNVLAGEESSVVCKIKGGATLKQTESVPLTLYKNGLVMFRGPFRPYSDPTTQACVQDLLDGFFPSELQTRYPEGIPFKLTDKRGQMYNPPSINGLLFPGNGYSLIKSPSHTPRPPLVVPHHHQSEGKTLSLERFLSRVPKHVVREGKVIDIHSELKNTLQGPPCTMTTTVDCRADNHQASPDHRTTRLRIRLPNEEQVIMKMRVSTSIRELRQCVDQLLMRSHDKSHDYVIKTSFPSRSLTDDGSTLLHCGLTPTGNVFIVPVKNNTDQSELI